MNFKEKAKGCARDGCRIKLLENEKVKGSEEEIEELIPTERKAYILGKRVSRANTAEIMM